MNLLQRTIANLIQKHGSYRRAAKVIGIDHTYLHKLFHGIKTPSDEVLSKFGLVSVVVYRRLK